MAAYSTRRAPPRSASPRARRPPRAGTRNSSGASPTRGRSPRRNSTRATPVSIPKIFAKALRRSSPRENRRSRENEHALYRHPRTGVHSASQRADIPVEAGAHPGRLGGGRRHRHHFAAARRQAAGGLGPAGGGRKQDRRERLDRGGLRGEEPARWLQRGD